VLLYRKEQNCCAEPKHKSRLITKLVHKLQFPLHPEDGGSNVLRNVGILPQHYASSQPRKPRVIISFVCKCCCRMYNCKRRNIFISSVNTPFYIHGPLLYGPTLHADRGM
jgi:hypothetical protein